MRDAKKSYRQNSLKCWKTLNYMKNDQSMESKIIVEVILKSAVKFFDQMAHKNYLFTFGKFPIKKL